MLAVIITLLLTFHLLALNIATAGPLVCCWLQLRRKVLGKVCGEAGKRLAWASIAALIVGVLLGLGLLVCVRWDGNSAYWKALARFPAEAYWYALVELMFSLLCLLAYAVSWDRLASQPWIHGLIAVLSSTNLFYHFPPLMSAIAEIAARPDLVVDDIITRPLVRELMHRPSVLSMAAHFSLASLAVAGVALMNIRRLSAEVNELNGGASAAAIDAPQSTAGIIAAGGQISLIVSTVQVLIGFIVVLHSSHIARHAMMGGDAISTGLIVAGLIGTFGLLRALGSVALGETSESAVRRCTILLLAVVLMMTGLLVRTRRLTSSFATADAIQPSASNVATDGL